MSLTAPLPVKHLTQLPLESLMLTTQCLGQQTVSEPPPLHEYTQNPDEAWIFGA